MKKTLITLALALTSIFGYSQCTQQPHSRSLTRSLDMQGKDAVNITDKAAFGELANQRQLEVTQGLDFRLYSYSTPDFNFQVPSGDTVYIRTNRTCPDGSVSEWSTLSRILVPVFPVVDPVQVTLTANWESCTIQAPMLSGYSVYFKYKPHGTTKYTTIKIPSNPYTFYGVPSFTSNTLYDCLINYTNQMGTAGADSPTSFLTTQIPNFGPLVLTTNNLNKLTTVQISTTVFASGGVLEVTKDGAPFFMYARPFAPGNTGITINKELSSPGTYVIKATGNPGQLQQVTLIK